MLFKGGLSAGGGGAVVNIPFLQQFKLKVGEGFFFSLGEGEVDVCISFEKRMLP